jgi:hypothetical protein
LAPHFRSEKVVVEPQRKKRELDEQMPSPEVKADGVSAEVLFGGLMHIISGLPKSDESRVGNA